MSEYQYHLFDGNEGKEGYCNKKDLKEAIL